MIFGLVIAIWYLDWLYIYIICWYLLVMYPIMSNDVPITLNWLVYSHVQRVDPMNIIRCFSIVVISVSCEQCLKPWKLVIRSAFIPNHHDPFQPVKRDDKNMLGKAIWVCKIQRKMELSENRVPPNVMALSPVSISFPKQQIFGDTTWYNPPIFRHHTGIISQVAPISRWSRSDPVTLFNSAKPSWTRRETSVGPAGIRIVSKGPNVFG